MIGGALLVRSALSDDGSDGSQARPLRLVCAQDLADVCADLHRAENVDVEVAAAGITADDAAKRDADGWLTIAPQPTMVNEARARDGQPDLLGPTSDPIARSPLVFVVWKDRGKVLTASCPRGELTWTCVGDAAEKRWATIAGGDSRWGDVKVTHTDPATDMGGVLALGAEAASKLGKVGLSRDDVEAVDFYDWYAALEHAASTRASEDPLGRMLQRGRADIDVVATLGRDACTRIAGAALRDQVEVVVPTPVATADVVYAPVVGRPRGDELGEVVTGDAGRRTLTAAGWRVGDARATGAACGASGTVPLPRDAQLPAAGVLAALVELRD